MTDSRRNFLMKAAALGAAAVAAPAFAADMPPAGKTTKDMAMRKKERELTTEQAYEVIEATDHAVLSTVDPEGYPYGVPITPVLLDKKTVYFHCAATEQSRKTANMKANPRVSLCFIAKGYTLPEKFSVDYASAIVAGKAHKVTNPEEKFKAICAIMSRHAPKNPDALNQKQLKKLDRIELWRVDVEKVSGKARSAKTWIPGVSVHKYEP